MLTFEGIMFFKSMHYAFEMPIVIFILFSPSHSMSILKVPIKYHMKILHFVKTLEGGFFLLDQACLSNWRGPYSSQNHPLKRFVKSSKTLG
jgi:hypothetical protein